MDKKNQPVKLRTLLQKVIYQKKWQQRMEIHTVFNFWEEVVGSEIASNAQPDIIHGKILWVEVSGSVWLQQLQYMKHEFLEKINQRLQPAKLDDIRFRTGYRRFEKQPPPKALQKIKPDEAKKKEFEMLIEGVASNDSREALKKLWLAFASNKKV